MDEDGRQALARAVYNNMQETAEMLLHWASYGSEGDSAAPLLLGHQDRWGSNFFLAAAAKPAIDMLAMSHKGPLMDASRLTNETPTSMRQSRSPHIGCCKI